MKLKVGTEWMAMAGVGLLLVVLTGCQPVAPAPVIEREPPPSRRIDHHYVTRGESLFDIAWRYELDMDTLAQVNNLPPPYHLTPGQRLNLDLRGRRAAPTGRTVTASGVVVQAAPGGGGLRVTESPAVVPPPQPRSEREVIPAPQPSTPATLPEPEPEPRVAMATPAPPPAARQPTPPATSPAMTDGAVDWHWPIPGRVSQHYDSAGVLKGVDIQSSEGQPIYPAAPGVVVYAGEGLRGYGRLIIIKHNNEYLSAYAHNRRILVDEGASVNRGTVIAEVGGAIDRPGNLYFEVRRNGKPINPLEVMPPP